MALTTLVLEALILPNIFRSEFIIRTPESAVFVPFSFLCLIPAHGLQSVAVIAEFSHGFASF